MNRDQVLSRHHDRLAVVYVRQSSLQQVHRNQESTRLQYSLVCLASQLGWPQDRIITVDDDLGLSGASAEGRLGFQRLLGEVALDHVGLVVGLEMSRLARSNRDWHQLLELCARFGTLIADLDGLYDPSSYNDRLLLGLKGTMSEAELHILRQRLLQGKLQKAKRGELGQRVPCGYLRTPSSEVVLDPDEEVRAVIDRIFTLFDEIRTVHGVLNRMVEAGVQIGGRQQTGDAIGELIWRRPHRGRILDILRNPIYAGAYVYGRRRTDPRRKKPNQPTSGRTSILPQDEWLVCIKDHFPAYITWEHFERNQEQLDRNRSSASTPGSARDGAALLTGLIACGECGRKMSVQYMKRLGQSYPRYVCNHDRAHYGGPLCQSISSPCVDEEVSRLFLAAVAPAALEVSLSAVQELEAERASQIELWEKRLQRAQYEAERAGRQYNAVEPENRLVARTLETVWNQKLSAHRQLEEDYRRFREQQPRTPSPAERDQIRQLALNLPEIWHAPTTSNSDRKSILRLLIDRVDVYISKNSEVTDIAIQWAGGDISKSTIDRPVARLSQLSNYDQIVQRMKDLRADGYTANQIAVYLNENGFKTPTRRGSFNERLVRAMAHRHGVADIPRGRGRPPGRHEWWLRDLAAELEMSLVTLYGWLRRGLLQARELDRRQAAGKWVVFADKAELKRLRQLRDGQPNGPRS